MNWKNQLTKTPYLVLFMVLISVGVGTASALITITLAGNVVVTGDLDVDGDIDTIGDIFAGDVFFGNGNFNGDTTVDGELSVGVENPNNDDFIRIDGGNENIQWDESQTRFRLSDSVVTGGHFAAGSVSADDTVNRFGDGTPQAPDDMTGFGDLYLADDLEVTDNLFVGGKVTCPDCIIGYYTAIEPDADGGDINKIVQCDPGDIATGGGFSASSTNNVVTNAPVNVNDVVVADGDVATGWKVIAFNEFDGTGNVFAICADFAPAHIP